MRCKTTWTKSLPTLTKGNPDDLHLGDSDTFALPETGREIEKQLPDASSIGCPGPVTRFNR